MHANATVKCPAPTSPGHVDDSIITSKFVSSDCGDVKPGQSKPVSLIAVPGYPFARVFRS